ncbi:MAG: hypothetical protein ACP5JU_01570 [Minisyncoccia bacterium]
MSIKKIKAQEICSYDTAIKKGKIGYLVSSIFDMQDTYSIIRIMWKGRLEGNTFVGFQLAGSSSASGPWIYIGPDGPNSYYTPSPGEFLNISTPSLSNIRYFRYKVFLGSCDYISIPEVNSIYIYYSK